MLIYSLILHGVILFNLGISNFPDPVVQPSGPTVNLIDSLASNETKELYNFLLKMGDSDQFLFGSHDQTAYGIDEGGKKWTDDGSGDKSDIKQVTGSHGAIFSWDVSSVTNTDKHRLDEFRNRVLIAHEMGGITTFCWHMNDPVKHSFYTKNIEKPANTVKSLLPEGEHHGWYLKRLHEVGEFFLDLTDSEGKAVPVIFRPFHEHNGDWFWWGKGVCKQDEYNSIWKFTVEYLRDSIGVHNLIYAFSPDGSRLKSKEDYLEIYPGDDYVDLFGFDYYFREDGQLDDFTKQLGWVIELANELNKVTAITETGNDKLELENWYTSQLLKGIELNNFRISYSAVWRNASVGHFYVPYPGHAAVPDFLDFYNHPATVFLDGVGR